MELTKQIIDSTAAAASQKIAKALSSLTNNDVVVASSEVKQVLFKDALNALSESGDHAVIVYSMVNSRSFSPGVAILTMPRADALNLIDLLNKKTVGSTHILNDFDRSAIKEVLNILGNSYIDELAAACGAEIRVEAPNMITVVRMNELMKTAFAEESAAAKNSTVMFENMLAVTKIKIKVGLFLLFHEEFVKLIKPN